MEDRKTIEKDLGQIADMLLLNGTLTECSGLVHGKMEITVFFFHYERHKGNEIKDFFNRQSMNLYDFGKINIVSNGDVYANLNHPSIGNIYIDNIYEIVQKEIDEGLSWLRIRNQAPCKDCAYQWLCPPPSNYEIIIGRPNLCHVKS